MKRNYAPYGNRLLKLGYACSKQEYYKTPLKLGKEGSYETIKICDIVRSDARNDCSRITLKSGKVIADSRCTTAIARLLPYNYFGFYTGGCIFNMHCIKSADRKAMSVLLVNKTKVKLVTRKLFNRFEEDCLLMKN